MVSGVNYKEMQRVFVVTLAVNIILAAAKLVVGIIYGSGGCVGLGTPCRTLPPRL